MLKFKTHLIIKLMFSVNNLRFRGFKLVPLQQLI
jgi:hypothetical protein